MKLIIGLLLGAVAIAAIIEFGDAPIAGGVVVGDALQSLLIGAILVSLSASALLHYRGRMSTALLSAIAWIAIFSAVVVGYTYRKDLEVVANRVMDEVMPGRDIASGPGEAIVVRARNGHFFMRGITNGKTLTYMFDTGASSVVLTAEDAKVIGLDPAKLRFSRPVSTANGRTMAAPITIDALSVGGITVRNVRAMVARPGALRENLLGMSYLEKLASYSVQGNRLILRR